ncbi:MAG: exonuclease domain-containing protein [Clostridium sp.]
MNFVAIDFETANEKRNSPCSLGITVVENNKIVEEKYFLIKPPELRFSNMNIMIHGIREEDVRNEKEFNELWDEIKPYLNNKVVVAHNAAFDISVLRRTLETYEIEFPEFEYICTMNLSKRFYSDLENAKLNTINNFLGYEFNHHNAAEDAKACANVLLNVLDELEGDGIEALKDELGLRVGYLNSEGYSPASFGKGQYKKSRREKVKRKSYGGEYFKDKVVVFTGPLTTMGRAEAMMIVRSLGGNTGGTITKKTSVLVVGGKKANLTGEGNSTSKMRKAWSYIDKGQEINIIDEKEFLGLI